LQLDYINNARQEMELVVNEPLENAPPSLAFATVALGAFRGLVVNVLWIRADRLKQEGQFFDAKQLAEWITILQPRFASVWEFQAWNMAYNISVAIPATEPHQRWRWVRNGYELLRDKGIEMNPRSLDLYRELARIFQHKMGGVTDDVHKYYKLQLADAMAPLLGPADAEYFEELIKAPKTLEEAMKIPGAEDLVNKLGQADEAFRRQDNFVKNYIAFRQNPWDFSEEAYNIFESYQNHQTLSQFDTFARAYHLRNEWKLEPELMHELNKNYGPTDWENPDKIIPLEWRHPAAHAIYWAVKGLRKAGGGGEDFSTQEANIDRMVAHSLQLLFRDGRIYVSEGQAGTEEEPMIERGIYLRPDLRMFDAYNRLQLELIEKYKQYADFNPGTYESMQIGHRNFLTNAVESFYHAGHRGKARQIYNKVRELYPREEHQVPMERFVRDRMREHLESITITNANEMIHGLLRESYFRFAVGEDDQAAAREDFARQVHQFYSDDWEGEDRVELAPMEMLRYFALQDFLSDGQFPHELRMNLMARIRRERPDLFERLQEQEEIYLQFQEEMEQQQQGN